MAAVSAWRMQQRSKGCWRPRLRCVLAQLLQAAMLAAHTHTQPSCLSTFAFNSRCSQDRHPMLFCKAKPPRFLLLVVRLT